MTQETPIDPPETIEKAKLEALVEEWREQAYDEWLEHDEPTGLYGPGLDRAINDLETLLDEHTEQHTDAATALANATGRPKEAFEADEYDMPNLSDLEPVDIGEPTNASKEVEYEGMDPEVKELVETMEDAT